MTEDTDSEATGDDATSDPNLGSSESILSRLEDLEDDAAEDERKYLLQVASPDYTDRLRAAAKDLLSEPDDFKVGDLVTWKPALRNRYFPANGAPAVVLGLTPGEVSAETNPASVFFGEPLDLRLGVIEGDGDLIVLHYDQRRFTHWHPEAADQDDE